MARHIKLIFPASAVEAVAALLEHEAPLTCDRIWESLVRPLEGLARQEREIGPALYIAAPPLAGLPSENASVLPIPGDVLFYAIPGLLPEGRITYTFHLFYARGAKGLFRVGWKAGNVFASITGGLENVRHVAKRIIETGPQPLRIERVS